jgi:hypothetical protein
MNDEWIPWVQGREIANRPPFRRNDGRGWAEANKVPFIQAKKNGRVFVSKLACERLGLKAPQSLELKPSAAPSTMAATEERLGKKEFSHLETAKNDTPADQRETAWHPESYDINIKITVSHAMLQAIFLKGQ